MRRITTALLTATLSLGLLAPADVAANQPDNRATAADQKRFDTLYRDQIRVAMRTSDKEDDLYLMDDLLTFAEGIAEDPALRGLAYIESIQLAASGGELATMMEVAELLEAHWPGHEAASFENLAKLGDRAYRNAPRDERAELAETYLDLLISMAKASAKEKDYKPAITRCRQAMQVARATEAPILSEIESLLNAYTDEFATINRIKLLSGAVEKNPTNTAAARELVNLLLIRRNDPQAAAQFTDAADNPELAELVSVAAKGVDAADAPQSLRLGDWYVKLSEDTKDRDAVTMLTQARLWYAQFIALYPREDALADRVRSMDQVAEGRIERIREANAIQEQAEEDTSKKRWTNLIAPPFDAAKHLFKTEGQARANKGVVMMQKGSLVVPFEPSDAFEIRLTITDKNKERFRESLGMDIPTSTTDSARTFVMRYSPNRERYVYLTGVQTEYLLNRAPRRNANNTYVLTIQVATLNNGQLAFALLIDGVPAAKWQGNASTLRYTNYNQEMKALGTALILTAYQPLTVHKIEYKER